MRPNPAFLSAVCLIPLMASAALAQNAGVTAAVNQQAAGTPPGGSIRTIVLGDNVVQNERIDTSAEGLVQILLADGTAFTVGPNSSLSIDRFVYDPQAGSAQVAATLTQGVFRFIGGRTSKTPGGVVLDTPVGTAGIRGAIVDIVLNPGSDGTVAEFAMRFGQDVTLTSPGGSSKRVFQPGYSIVVGGNGRVSVVPTPPGNAIQNALAGRPGTTGGAPVSPTNPMVAASQVPGSNSEQPIVVIAAPVPTPRPKPIARAQEIVVAEATRDAIRGVVERNPGAPPPPEPEQPPVVDPEPEPEPPVQPEPPVIEPEPEPEPPVEPEPEPEPEPPVVEPEPEPPVEPEPEPPVDPEPEPPVEPEPEPPVEPEPSSATRLYRETPDGGFEQTDVALVETDDGRLQGMVEEDILDLPVIFDPEEDETPAPLRSVVLGSGVGTGPEGDAAMALMVEGEPEASLGDRPLNGVAYAGRDGFRAYLTRAGALPGEGSGGEGSGGEGSGGEGPGSPAVMETSAGDLVFAIDGTPTDVEAVFGGTGVRRYALQADPFEGFAAPFLVDYGVTADSGAVSDMYLVESEDVAGGLAKMLQISLLIEDFEGGQPSQVGVNVGSIIDRGSGFGFEGLRRGGDRLSGGGVFGYYGNLTTLPGSQGGTSFFGGDGEYFVVSSATSGGISERSPGGSLSQTGSTTHVGSLIERDALAAAGRRTEPLQGFSAGLATVGGGEGGRSIFVRSRDASDTSLTFSPAANSVSTAFTLSSDVELPSLILSLSAGGAAGPSAFATNDVYAATARDSGAAVILDDTTLTSTGEIGTYAFSGRAAPIAGFDPFGTGEGRCESCGFIDWGWWGTQVSGSSDGSGTQTVGVHLGNWVAGDIVVDPDQLQGLADTAGSVAVYSGGTLGTVVTGGQTFVASGNFDMNVSLGTREGSFSITGFGGRDFNGEVVPSQDAGFELGAFERAGPGASIAGSGSGAFVNGPGIGTPGLAQGVIGNFEAFEDSSGGDWRATGIFAGERTFLFDPV